MVKIKSWYPEFKDFPSIEIGKAKILFTYIPDLDKTVLGDNDINLVSNCETIIEETEKSNQFVITVLQGSCSVLELEVWFEIGNSPVVLFVNDHWMNIKECYPLKGDRVMIDRIKLKVVN